MDKKNRLIIIGVIVVVMMLYFYISSRKPNVYYGYIEGEELYIAGPLAGNLVKLGVRRGQFVKKGDLLFRIDPTQAESNVKHSKAALEDAKAALANFEATLNRPEEQAVVVAQYEEAKAHLVYTQKQLERYQELVKKDLVSQSQADSALADRDQAQAKLDAMMHQEKVGLLSAREHEIDQAQAKVLEAEANLREAEKVLVDIQPVAQVDEWVEDTFFKEGEWVAAGSPVVSVLLPNDVKLRFFVPQAEIARMMMGKEVTFTVDGVKQKLTAKINYVAPRAEYTPPVIYSEHAREKLVFLVEAHPTQYYEFLRPGLPIEVKKPHE